MTKLLPDWLAAICISLLAYSILFYLNNWLTQHLSFSFGVNWIYLPAGLRLFLVLIFGFPGALGIVLGSFFISYTGENPPDLTSCIGIGLISGFAPYLARVFVLNNIQVTPDMSNFSLPKLSACILIFSLLSAGLHQWWFAIRGFDDAGTFNHFIAMLVGDILGTILLIAVIKYGLDLVRPINRLIK
ncbi:hypothetical protein TUM22923_01390 [Polynucleobacter sp. TUM22923]|jgi:hypothetical protein|uniref:hypothetical protein n=1 Tax=Polynucleobacter sp. TUM22923 TaxID=3022126 RepID=UPI002573579A|nr:hypothetical protein [Polynucleobacter sp. TUM22923]BDX20818.1 hypothetical protein TUM22923_01390 [Polynucleobacter sp. TUM22923]